MLKEFFATGSYKNEEITSAIGWYFESKNFHLEKAIAIRNPLTVESKKELRIAYSNYFTSLMAAIEVLLEKSYKNRDLFCAELYASLTFDGKSGEDCYNYMRELRNSIVHRGYDISSGAVFSGNFPILIAPSEIPNKSGITSYGAFGESIIEIIGKVESVIGNIFLKHIQEKNLFAQTYSDAEKKKMIIKIIPKIPHMPQWAKDMAINAFELTLAKLKAMKLLV